MKLGEALSLSSLVTHLRSRRGRVAMAAIGLTVIVALLRRLGVQEVWTTLRTAAWTIPVVMLADLLFFGCEVVGLRTLYADDRHKIPTRELVRGSLIGHTVATLMPMGKPVGEGVKASIFSRWTSVARSIAAMARFQGVVLVVNALISVPIGAAAWMVSGPSLLTLAVGVNIAVTFITGSSILFVGRHSRVGDWLSKKMPRAEHAGPEFDRLLRREPTFPFNAIAWCFLGRTFQSVGYVVLLYAVSGSVSVTRALTALAIALVGAMLGEILPNALGAAEANFAYFAPLLHLARGQALAIPLITHLSVLTWAAIGALVPVVWPPLEPPRVAAPEASGITAR